jgi:hypothetical protein
MGVYFGTRFEFELCRGCPFGSWIAPIKITFDPFELGHYFKNVFLELQPIGALAGLTIWDTLQGSAKLAAQGLKNCLGVVQGHAANKVNVPMGTAG